METLDLWLAIALAFVIIGWYDERQRRRDVESRLKKHRTNVLIDNAGGMDELIKRGG